VLGCFLFDYPVRVDDILFCCTFIEVLVASGALSEITVAFKSSQSASDVRKHGEVADLRHGLVFIRESEQIEIGEGHQEVR
jgi:hypothetical protein